MHAKLRLTDRTAGRRVARLAVPKKPSPTGLSLAHLGQLPPGAARFCGTWRVGDTENYEAYLEKLGVAWIARKAMLAARFTVTYSIQDGVLHGDATGCAHDVFRTDQPVQLAMQVT